MGRIILTKKEAEILVKSEKKGFANISLDLGKSTSKVDIREGNAIFEDQSIPLKKLEKTKDETCYVVEENELRVVELFSEETNLYYKLKPTQDWPTVTLSSVPMHRFKKISPKTSAELMVSAVSPIFGRVLDTCCGLGYTSLLSAKQKGCNEVVVFERDENVLRVCEYNPWSEELFSNKKIKLNKENVAHGIKNLPSESFDCVIHDPPTVSFAPQLYEAPFYAQLFRVMKKGAKLYHYCPAPGKTKGKELWPSMEKKLIEAGFSKVEYSIKSSGVKAIKK